MLVVKSMYKFTAYQPCRLYEKLLNKVYTHEHIYTFLYCEIAFESTFYMLLDYIKTCCFCFQRKTCARTHTRAHTVWLKEVSSLQSLNSFELKHLRLLQNFHTVRSHEFILKPRNNRSFSIHMNTTEA